MASPCSGQLPQPPQGQVSRRLALLPSGPQEEPKPDALWLPFHQNPQGPRQPRGLPTQAVISSALVLKALRLGTALRGVGARPPCSCLAPQTQKRDFA